MGLLINRTCKFKNCRYGEFEDPVQNGLAITPAQMLDLTNRGIPVSPSNLGLEYDDGYSELEFDVPSEHVRGIDMADLWEQREDMRDKMRSPKFKELLNSQGNE